MRRILPYLLMLVITLQASWSAAASVCRHEAAREAAHFGHHMHADDHAALADAADAETAPSAQLPHLDCIGCHGGLCAALVGLAPPAATLQLPAGGSTPYLRAVTDGLPERLIRPPHSFLA